LEIVVVDNASSDGVVEQIRSKQPGIDVIVSARNRGFAGGNNLALRDRTGVNFIALINPDTQVTSNWLAPLVDALEQDQTLGAACPKLLLSGSYSQVAILSATRAQRGLGFSRPVGVMIKGIRVEGVDVTSRTRYASGTWGPEGGGRRTDGSALLYVPVAGSSATPEVSIQLESPVQRPVTLESDGQSEEYVVGPAGRWCAIGLAAPAGSLVNNVGTNLIGDGYGIDRGWLEVDSGQYDEPTDVFAWSGGAALIRAAYLDDLGLFDERLFLYYEDFELAWRGQARGWRYRAVPSSVIYHDHATSAIEGSEISDFYNERNRLLVVTRHGRASLALRAWARYLSVTASYCRRDLVSRLHGEPADWLTFRRRLRSFFGAVPLVPAMLVARQMDRRSRHAH
jgi:GT2 family glycosyltransferase